MQIKLVVVLSLLCLVARGETALKVYSTISELKGLDVTSAPTYPNNTVAKVLGYYNANDGGGGEFRLVRSTGGTLSADNGGTIIAPSDDPATTSVDESAAGRWIRICDPGFVNVLWFGAKPSPSHSVTPTDSLSFIQNAYNSLPKVDAGGKGAGENGIYARAGILYFPHVAYPSSGDSAGLNMASTNYYVSDTLNVGERLTIRGDGPSRVSLCFTDGVAPSATAEKFLIYFNRYIEAGVIGANVTFDTGIEGLSLSGSQSKASVPWTDHGSADPNIAAGSTNPGSSGVFMDAAQMSFVRNCFIQYFGLRCLVGAPYTIENVSSGNCRGPAFDLSWKPMAIDETTSKAMSGDGKVHATNLFFGDVGSQLYNFPTDAAGDHYAAIRLRDCNLFVCSDLRVEQCPKVIKAERCSHVSVTSVNSVNYSPIGSHGEVAITLKDVGTGIFNNLVLNLYAHNLRDNVSLTSMGPSDLLYGNDVSSWERNNVGQTIFTQGGKGTKIYGSGSNNAFRVVSKPNDGGYNLANYEDSYVAEFYNGNFSSTIPLEDSSRRVLGIRKDGQFVTKNGTGDLAVVQSTGQIVTSAGNGYLAPYKSNIGGQMTTPYGVGSPIISTSSTSLAAATPAGPGYLSPYQFTTDGQIATSIGSGFMALAGLATSIVQPPVTTSTFDINVLASKEVFSTIVTMPTGTTLRPGDVVAASLVRDGIVTGVGGPALPTGVFFVDGTVTATNQVTLRFVNNGATSSTAVTGIQYKVTVMKDTR